MFHSMYYFVIYGFCSTTTAAAAKMTKTKQTTKTKQSSLQSDYCHE